MRIEEFKNKANPLNSYECGYIFNHMCIKIVSSEEGRYKGFHEYEEDFKIELRNALKYLFLMQKIDIDRAIFEYISQYRFFRGMILDKYIRETNEENSRLEKEITQYLTNDIVEKSSYRLTDKDYENQSKLSMVEQRGKRLQKLLITKPAT